MAFPPFSKNDEPSTKKKTTTGADQKSGDHALNPAGTAERAGRQEAAPAPDDDDDLSLDFSHYAPPPPKAKTAPPEPGGQPAVPAQKRVAAPPAPARKPDAAAPIPQAPLQKPDAAAPGQRSPAPKSAGAPAASPPASASMPSPQAPAPGAAAPVPQRPPAQVPARAAAPAPPTPVRTPAPVASSEAHTPPVIEEAAILFANGQSLQALAALTRAVHDGDLGSSALQAWLMLFDLYRSLSMRTEFEALGMEFLVKFERSPPVWIEAEPQSGPALATGGIGHCALTGVLSDDSASQLEQLRRMGQRHPAIRIDFTKLHGIDPFGCARLLAVLEVLKTSGKEAVFTGEAHLLGLLEAECQTENRDTDGVLWSLLFEILRRLGLKDRFEEAAVNYAVTYEVSPPSWETQTEAKSKVSPGVAATEPAQPAFRLSGDVTGANESLPKSLQDWAESNSPLVIDLSAVHRVDLVSARQLLDVFTKLHEAGATIQIRGANELVAALFGAMGIQRVARIVRN